MKKVRTWMACFLGARACAILLFIAVYLYVWLRIEPSLRYHYSTAPWFFGYGYFEKFLAYPGGVLEYAAAFLSQMDSHDVFGSLVATGLSIGAFLTTRFLLSIQNGSRGAGIDSVPQPVLFSETASYVPPIILLLLWNLYDSTAYMAGLGFLMPMTFSLGLTVIPLKSGWLRMVSCWLLAMAVFYLGGVWPCLLFVGLGFVFEVVEGKRWLLALGCLAGGLIVPAWRSFHFDAPPASFIKDPAYGWFFYLCLALYLFVPVVRLAQSVLLFIVPVETCPLCRWFCANANSYIIRKKFVPLTICLCGFATAFLSFDKHRKDLISMAYWADSKQWDKIVALGARQERLDTPAKISLCRALYHTGRLSEDLFSYVPLHGFDLISGFKGGQASFRAQSAMLLELGHANVAERYAHESLECEGERPETLKILAQINVLKGRPQAARIFLNVLEKIPFHGNYAREALHSLDSKGILPESKELSDIQSRLVATDQTGSTVPTEMFLRQLLHSNPQNNMAYEYMMAQYLMTLQIDLFINSVKRLPELGFMKIPRHFEEALLLSQFLLKKPPVEIPGRQIHPETIQRFNQFTDRVNRGDFNTPDGRQSLMKDFGNTYWLYYLLDESRESTINTPKS